MARIRQGVVSVILVNFRGADDTIEAIGHLDRLDWPKERLEVVVVENASGDDSAKRIRAAAPHVRLVISKSNGGFAGGCNKGVAASSGEFVALLNNDARPDPAWVRAAVEKFAESPDIGAVASRVLDWEGKLVDYIGSAMTWYGMAYKPFTAEPIPHRVDTPRDVLFGTGSAMFVRRSVFDALGGFDESYFMFFEDVDLGWRLNLRGWRYAYEPRSLAYHKHHASMKEFGSHKETYLLERNALYTLYKNIGKKSLDETLTAALLLAIRRAISFGKLDSTAFDLRQPSEDENPYIAIPRQTLSVLFGLDQFVDQLPNLVKSRAAVQSTRVVSDKDIWRLFGLADTPVRQEKDYVKGYVNIVEAFDVAEPARGTRVVIVTGDPIGRKLAGPAIRAWNMARLLSSTNEVKLVSLSGVELIEAPFDLSHVRPGDDKSFARFEAWADVIIFQGHAMAVFDSLRTSSKILVVDVYDPMHLEQLEQGRQLSAVQWSRQVSDATDVLNQQLERGDFFMAASDRQRMFWLGQLAALGRINPATYDGDPDLDGLISVVPFGLDSAPPQHRRNVLKGTIPGIGANDKVLLWSGGLYDWFDPETLIRAVAELAKTRPNVRLFFQGTKHPHPGVPEMAIVGKSRALAEELGVIDRVVFFNDSWVDYMERENYLTEADVGVSTHYSHIETTFSFRTRILDYLWAGLPMVVTKGDHFGDLIEAETLGVAVAAQDVSGLVAALDRALFDAPFIATVKANVARVRERYYWERTLEPLVRFVGNPHAALDRGQTAAASTRRRKSIYRTGWRNDLSKTAFYLRNGGPAVVLAKVRTRLWRV